MSWFRYIVILCLPLLAGNGVKQRKESGYFWKSVQIVGGGFVDGIVFHPVQKGVRYCRTDIGGAYRWDDDVKQWSPILDWVPYADLNFMGVESIALDPANPNRVYLACGTYTNATTPNGAILRSEDRGLHFKVTRMPFKMGGNENGRGNGERMMVDPNNPDIIYFGSRHAGLWKSVDRAVTWTQVKSFPAVEDTNTQGVGINCIVFDPTSRAKGKGSTVVYAAVSQMGRESVFQSLDAGVTWQPVPNQPTAFRPTHMVLGKSGDMYITYGTNAGPNRMNNGAVWKYATKTGQWTDVTPEKPDPENQKAFGYAAVSIDSKNPNTLIVSSFYRPGGEQIYRSTNAGQSWKQVIGGPETYDFSIAPFVSKTGIHWLFDIEIDPFDPNHAIFTTGYGGYETFNLTNADQDKSVKWSVMSRGIEETVALDLVSPTAGPHLLSGIGDYGGFVHWDLDKPAPEGSSPNPRFGNTTGVACADNAPNVMVRVGRPAGSQEKGSIAYSLDGGRSWQPTESVPVQAASLGRIAVSVDGKTWIWTLRQGSYWTTDNGKTWSQCTGLPGNMRAVADRVNPKKFYALSLFDSKIYVSEDSGASFEKRDLNVPNDPPKPGGNRGDSRGGQDQLYATPGYEGEVWVAAFDGLYRSMDTGRSCTRFRSVEEVHAFGFGKGKPGVNYPSLFLVGTIDGERGVFRSDDCADTWIRINDDQHQYGLILQVTGDPRVHTQVYLGTHGRGIMYGYRDDRVIPQN